MSNTSTQEVTRDSLEFALSLPHILRTLADGQNEG
jgi:hypothetical protein